MKKLSLLITILSLNCGAVEFNSEEDMRLELKENLIKIKEVKEPYERGYLVGRSEAIADFLDMYERWEFEAKITHRQNILANFKEISKRMNK